MPFPRCHACAPPLLAAPPFFSLPHPRPLTCNSPRPALFLSQSLLEALRLWDSTRALAADQSTGVVDPSLVALAVPPIRADLALRERHCAAAAAAVAAGRPAMPRLSAPLHAFGGTDERSFTPEQLAAWRAFAAGGDDDGASAHEPTRWSTLQPNGNDDGGSGGGGVPFDPSARFSCTLLPGGHFYAYDAVGSNLLLSRIVRVLRSAVDALPRSVLAGPPLPDQSSSLPYAHEMVEACAVATPSAVALVDANGSRSYAEVVHDSELVGAWLVAEGSAPGLAVAMLMGHCAEMLIAQLGVAMSGAACFGLENHFGPQMMRELLSDTEPVAALAPPSRRRDWPPRCRRGFRRSS